MPDEITNAMRGKRLITFGLLLYAAAWCLPVHRDGGTLPEEIPGLQAFLVALSVLWDTSADGPYGATLSVAGAATNLLVAALLFVWPRRSTWLVRLIGWACLFSLLLNAQWYLSDFGPGLRIGYFLWWISFGVIGTACLCQSTAER